MSLHEASSPPKSWCYGELWDLYDESRNPLHKTHRRGDPLPPGAFHVVSEIWTVDAQNRLLLTLRAPDKEFYPDLWETTAGSILAGEDSRTGAVRELFEETGLVADPNALHLIGVLAAPGVFVDVYVHRLKVDGVTLQRGETAASRFVFLSELDEMLAQGLLAPHIVRHLQTVRQGLAFFLDPIVSPGIYRHYKGNIYEALGMARHSETLEPLVVYRATGGSQEMWARPAAMWFDLVPQGALALPRFAQIEP